jgi:type II secretory pathway pseudopilin PulG
MRLKPNSRPGKTRHEEGFLLLGVLFMVLLVTIALAIAAPKMAEAIRRDKEIETVHRGLQYARAIQIYFNKYGRYPNTIDQLVKSDNQRFLRKRYLNPMTGKDDWRIIHYGEAKVPPVGLFGQTVGQTGGITPTGATNGASATGIGGSSSPFGGSGTSGSGFGSSGSSFGSSGSMYSNSGSSPGSSGSMYSNSGSSPSSSGSPFGSSGSSFGSGSSSSPFSSSGSSGSTIGGTNSGSGSGFGSSGGIGGTSTTGADGSTTTGASGPTNNIGGVQTTGGSGSAFGSPGVSVGGAPIVGVGLMDKKTSIKIYKKQTHYNQWEFVYDPNQNTAIASGGTINGGGTSTGTGMTGGTGSGFGSSGGSGFGGSSGSGFGGSSGSGFGGSSGSGFGGSSGSGFGGSPSSPPSAPVNNNPQ